MTAHVVAVYEMKSFLSVFLNGVKEFVLFFMYGNTDRNLVAETGVEPVTCDV